MNFDDIRDQLKERLEQLKGSIIDSSLYISLSEKYADLSTRNQALVKLAAGAGILYFILSFPLSAYFESAEFEQLFLERRDAVHAFFNISIEEQANPQISQGLSEQELIGRVQREFEIEKLIPDQSPQVVAKREQPTLFPAGTDFARVQATAKKLNLRQVINLAARFNAMNPSSFLLNLVLQENAGSEGGYFDVEFDIVSFLLADDAAPTAQPQQLRRGRR